MTVGKDGMSYSRADACTFRGGSQEESLLFAGDDEDSGEVRYEYEHSILPYSDPACTGLRPGHRVSIMIRVSRPHTSRYKLS